MDFLGVSKIEERLRAARHPHWTYDPRRCEITDGEGRTLFGVHPMGAPAADLVAHAPADLAALCADLRLAWAENKALRADLATLKGPA